MRRRRPAARAYAFSVGSALRRQGACVAVRSGFVTTTHKEEDNVDGYETLVGSLALAMGASWASGLNLYAAVFMLGVGGASGAVELPQTLAVVEQPMVILAAGLMYCIEFMADKVPGLDSAWDSVHTFVRIPAGALLAAGAVGTVDPSWQVAAGLLGGSVAGMTHAGKASGRLLINASPEPVSNWIASVTEDVAVFGGLWMALAHPGWFLAAFVLFMLLLAWLLPKMLRTIGRVFACVGRWFGRRTGQAAGGAV